MQDEHGSVNGWPTPVPWTVADLFFALVFYLIWPAVIHQALLSSGIYRWFYGPELVQLAERPPGHADDAEPADTPERQLARYRLSLWTFVLAFPFQLASILLALVSVSGTRPAQVGLTTRRLGRNLLAGFGTGLFLIPATLAVNLGVTKLYELFTRVGGEEHPLTRLAHVTLLPVEWVLLVLSAVVVAAVLEELGFRGLLQPWLAKYPWGGPLAMGAALFLALSSRWGHIQRAWSEHGRPSLNEFAPALFVLALVPVSLLVHWRSRTNVGPAIFGTAVLFAAIHSAVWPSPVALLVLALGLGSLAYRTQSLVGPIAVHALFNGVNCVLLVFHLG